MSKEKSFMEEWLFADLEDLIDCDFSSAPAEREEKEKQDDCKRIF